MTLLQARIWSGFVTTVGVIGFVGLLVASSFIPDDATFLRFTAFAWFFSFGIVRIALWQFSAKRAGPSGKKPANRSIKPQPR